MALPLATESSACGGTCTKDLKNSLKKLQQLLDQRFYDPEDEEDRNMLAYVYVPIVQREIDLFVELWNNSRNRLQRNTLMPDGIPNVIHSCPEECGMEDNG